MLIYVVITIIIMMRWSFYVVGRIWSTWSAWYTRSCRPSRAAWCTWPQGECSLQVYLNVNYICIVHMWLLCLWRLADVSGFKIRN